MTSFTADHWLVILVGLDVVLSLVSVGLALAEKKKPARKRKKAEETVETVVSSGTHGSLKWRAVEQKPIGDVDPSYAAEHLALDGEGHPHVLESPKPKPRRTKKPKKEDE